MGLVSSQMEQTGFEELVVKVHLLLLLLIFGISSHTQFSLTQTFALRMATTRLIAKRNKRKVLAVDLFAGSLYLEEFTKLEFEPHNLAPIYDTRASNSNWFMYKEQDDSLKSVSPLRPIFYSN